MIRILLRASGLLLLPLFVLTGCDIPAGLLAPIPTLSQDQIGGTVAAAIDATRAQFSPTSPPTSTPTASRTRTPTRSPSATPFPTPTSSPTPTITTFSSLTPVPDKLLITVSIETHCRSGPGRAYPRLSALPVDQPAEVIAQDPTGHYWYIPNPENTSGHCWVWDEYATFNADTSLVPVYTSMPPPTETPRPTATLYSMRRVQAGPSGREIIFAGPDTGTKSLGFIYDGDFVTLLPQPLNPRGRPYARWRVFNYIETANGIQGWVRKLSDGQTGFLVLVKPEDWRPFGKRKPEP